jgi:hypothetical protein
MNVRQPSRKKKNIRGYQWNGRTAFFPIGQMKIPSFLLAINYGVPFSAGGSITIGTLTAVRS